MNAVIPFSGEGRKLTNDTRCKLRAPVAELIAKVFNEDFLGDRMKELRIDPDKINSTHTIMGRIERAFEVLDLIRDAVIQEQTKERRAILAKSMAAFYELIPHHDPVELNTEELVEKKIEQLGELIELVEIEKMKQMHGISGPRHVLDQLYDHIKCEIVPLDRECSDFKMIERYMDSGIHCNYNLVHNYEIAEVFSLRRLSEDISFRKDLPNRTLLWHGSPVVNYCGILTQGLRIAPKEASSITGQAFGRGIYFSDNFNVSLHYCRALYEQEALMLLCEVALGECREGFRSGNLSNGKNWNSTCVRRSPMSGALDIGTDPEHIQHPDGYVVPLGQPYPVKQIRQNYFIIPKTDQARLRFVVKVRVKPVEPPPGFQPHPSLPPRH